MSSIAGSSQDDNLIDFRMEIEDQQTAKTALSNVKRPADTRGGHHSKTPRVTRNSLKANEANQLAANPDKIDRLLDSIDKLIVAVNSTLTQYQTTCMAIEDPVAQATALQPLLQCDLTRQSLNMCTATVCMAAGINPASIEAPPSFAAITASDTPMAAAAPRPAPARYTEPMTSSYRIHIKAKPGRTEIAMDLYRQLTRGKDIDTHEGFPKGCDATIHMADKISAEKAMKLLTNATINKELLTDIFTVTLTTRSLYSVKTAPMSKDKKTELKWHNEKGIIEFERVSRLLYEYNHKWFTSPRDIESIEFHTMNGNDNLNIVELYVSKDAYERFLLYPYSTRTIDTGFTYLKVYEEVQIDHCFRCLEYGHSQRACEKANPPKPPKCKDCGGPHESRDCKEDQATLPRCFRCVDLGRDVFNHHALSMACPSNKERRNIIRERKRKEAVQAARAHYRTDV